MTQVPNPYMPWDRERRGGFCPNCNVHSGFGRRLIRQIHPRPSDNYLDFVDRGSVVEVVWECLNCERTVTNLYVAMGERELLQLVVPGGTQPKWFNDEYKTVDVWPARTPRTLNSVVPEDIRSLFDEGSVCEAAGAMREAGALYRASVEALIKDQGGEGKDLHAKIESVKDKLGDDLTTNFHEARMLGNDGLHKGIDYSADEVADIADLIDEACQLLYVEPAKRAALREARATRREAARARQHEGTGGAGGAGMPNA